SSLFILSSLTIDHYIFLVHHSLLLVMRRLLHRSSHYTRHGRRLVEYDQRQRCRPVKSTVISVHGITWRNTAPFCPLMPAVLAPSTMFAGATALPIAPPALCAAMMVSCGNSCKSATVACKSAKS